MKNQWIQLSLALLMVCGNSSMESSILDYRKSLLGLELPPTEIKENEIALSIFTKLGSPDKAIQQIIDSIQTKEIFKDKTKKTKKEISGIDQSNIITKLKESEKTGENLLEDALIISAKLQPENTSHGKWLIDAFFIYYIYKRKMVDKKLSGYLTNEYLWKDIKTQLAYKRIANLQRLLADVGNTLYEKDFTAFSKSFKEKLEENNFIEVMRGLELGDRKLMVPINAKKSKKENKIDDEDIKKFINWLEKPIQPIKNRRIIEDMPASFNGRKQERLKRYNKKNGSGLIVKDRIEGDIDSVLEDSDDLRKELKKVYGDTDNTTGGRILSDYTKLLDDLALFMVYNLRNRKIVSEIPQNGVESNEFNRK